MKCTLAEQLIPLFAGGDLQPPEAETLRQHLDACAACRQLAEEFAASQSWLREFAAPEFDEAVFADLRASVLKEIAQAGEGEQFANAAGLAFTQSLSANNSSWLGWLLPRWNPRLAFAAAALILLAGLAWVVVRHQPSPRETTVAGGDSPKPSLPPAPRPVPKQVQVVAQETPNPAHPRPALRPRPAALEKRHSPVAPPATDLTAQSQTDPLTTTVEPTTNSDLTALAPEREMLRIELQTADPNIRIIWLTPKADTDSTPKTK